MRNHLSVNEQSKKRCSGSCALNNRDLCNLSEKGRSYISKVFRRLIITFSLNMSPIMDLNSWRPCFNLYWSILTVETGRNFHRISKWQAKVYALEVLLKFCCITFLVNFGYLFGLNWIVKVFYRFSCFVFSLRIQISCTSFCLSSALSVSLLPAPSLSPTLFFCLVEIRYILGVGREVLSNLLTF